MFSGLPGLVELLRRAEANVAKDGWPSQADAIAFIKTVTPDKTPRKHTFGSWRQVLRDADVFEVRRGPVTPDWPMEIWYQSRS